MRPDQTRRALATVRACDRPAFHAPVVVFLVTGTCSREAQLAGGQDIQAAASAARGGAVAALENEGHDASRSSSSRAA